MCKKHLLTRGTSCKSFHCNNIGLFQLSQSAADIFNMRNISFKEGTPSMHFRISKQNLLYAVLSFESNMIFLEEHVVQVSEAVANRCIIFWNIVQNPFRAMARWFKTESFYVCCMYAVSLSMSDTYHGIFPSTWVEHLIDTCAYQCLLGNEVFPFNPIVFQEKECVCCKNPACGQKNCSL